MRKILLTILGIIIASLGLYGIYSEVQSADPFVFFRNQGGTGTSSKPTDGHILAGDGTGEYGLVEVVAGDNMTISTTTSADGLGTWTFSATDSVRLADVILTVSGATTYLRASTTGNAWLFPDGFVSQASSTVDSTLTMTGDLILTDNDAVALGTGSDSRLYYDGTDTFLDLRAVGTGDLMIALAGSFPSPDAGTVHIWEGSAGVITADGNLQLVIENSGNSGINILSGNTSVGLLAFGDDGSALAGFFQYDHNNTRMDFGVEGSARVILTTSSFDFQQASTITTANGALTISPNTDTILTTGFVSQASSTIIGDFTVDSNTLFVDASENDVAIGTTTTGLASLYIEGDTSHNAFQVGTSTNSDLFIITSEGRVGIGTTTPLVALHVGEGAGVTAWFNGAAEDGLLVDTSSVVARLAVQGTVQAELILHNTGGTADQNMFRIMSFDDNISFQIFDDAFSAVERTIMTFDNSNGNVGIGTTTPGTLLSINGAAVISSGSTIYGDLTVGTFTGTSTAATSTLAGGLAIETSGLVYDFSSNNVGIGTAAPSSRLTIQGSTVSVAGSALVITSNFNDGVYINLGANRTIGVFTGGNLFMGFNTYYDTSSNSYEHATNGEAALIEWTTDGTIEFLTSVSASAGTEYVPDLRMIIQNDGTVGIGTTTPYAQLSVSSIAVGTSALVLDALSGQTAPIFDVKLASTTQFIVDSNGNVGVGTSTPWGLLSVEGTNNPLIAFATTSGTTAFIIDSNGKVGIGGTTTPQTSFAVSSGAVYVEEEPLTDAATVAINLNARNQGRVVLAGDRTLSLRGGYQGQVYRLILYQDSTGNRRPSWAAEAGNNILFLTTDGAATTTPSMSTIAGGCDVFSINVSQGTSSLLYLVATPSLKCQI